MYESTTTEFKREYVDDIKKTVIAFANTEGGKLLIGVDDAGRAIGIKNVDETLLRITNTIRDTIKPDVTLFIKYHNEVMDGKSVISINVDRGTARPYYLAGKEIRPEGVYVRQGASTVPATETAILQMIKETSGDSYENSRALQQDLSFGYAEKFFSAKNLPFSETQRKTLGLIAQDDTYTNLALLLSDQCVHTIKLAVFQGDAKIIFQNRFESSGSLLKQMEDAYDFINKYNRTRSEFSGLYRIDMRDYPPEALREALLNTIIHRDYSFSGSILISIFENRIEFVNIGGIVKGISYNDILLGVSASRNKKLADVFYRLDLIEAYGTGILKINNAYEEYYCKPKFEASDNAFKVTLYNTNYLRETMHTVHEKPAMYGNARKEKLLTLAKQKPFFRRKDVENELAVSQATAVRLLTDLVNKGLLLKSRDGRNTFYSYSKD